MTWDSSRWLDCTVILSYYGSFSSIGKTVKSKCLFIGPSITQLLKHGIADIISKMLDDLYFDKADFVFCSVKDSNNPEEDGSGSHWSLLVIDNAIQKAYHFDLASTLNLISSNGSIKGVKHRNQKITYLESSKCKI